MGIVLRLIRGIDALNRGVGHLAGWVSLAMVLVVVGDVVMRYAFATSFVFIQELEWHLFGVMFLLGAGYTLLQDGHVRVDVLYQRFSPKTRAWINLIGVLLFLLPGCLMVLDTSWSFFLNSVAMGEGSPDPGGIPARYVLKFFIPLGFVLLILQGVSMGLKSLLEICGRPYAAAQEVGS